jgi:hypothetical protein
MVGHLAKIYQFGFESGPSPDNGKFCQFPGGLPPRMVQYRGLASYGWQRQYST